MAPRADRPRARPRSRSSSSPRSRRRSGLGAVTAFNVAFTLLQIPLGVIGVPLGIVVLPSLSREARARATTSRSSRCSTRALRLLIYVMVPIAVARPRSCAARSSRSCSRRQFDRRRLDLTPRRCSSSSSASTAHALIAVLARAFYARQDTLTPVIAAVVAVVVNTTLAVVLVGPLGLPGVALAIAIAAWLEAVDLLVAPAPPAAGLRALGPARRRVAPRRVGAAVAGAVAAGRARAARPAAVGRDPASWSCAARADRARRALAFGLV